VIERDVKQAVKEIILELAPNAHIFMPVQTGFGAPDLDFIVSINGYALRIETKVDGKQPTDRQKQTTAALVRAGVTVLWVDQHNLEDVAQIVLLFVDGRPGSAFGYASDFRERYEER
jgi:hypothetical protein